MSQALFWAARNNQENETGKLEPQFVLVSETVPGIGDLTVDREKRLSA